MTQVWRAPGEMHRSVAAHGGHLTLDAGEKSDAQKSASSSSLASGAAAFAAARSEPGRHALHMLRLVLETMHHMALTFYAAADVAQLAPPAVAVAFGANGGANSAGVVSPDAVYAVATNLVNKSSASASAAAAAAALAANVGSVTTFKSAMCAPIGARTLGGGQGTRNLSLFRISITRAFFPAS